MTNKRITAFCGKAPQWLKAAFSIHGVELVEIGTCNSLQAPVAHHIDMMALPISEKLLVAPETAFAKDYFPGKEIVVTKERLIPEYPGDVLLNAVWLPDYLICNTNTVAKEILQMAYEQGKTVIHVNQGYTKCATCIISDTAIITEDESIYEASQDKLDVLLIKKGEALLPGYEYGFIGGASALIGDTVYFFGNIENHPDYEAIQQFIALHNKRIVSLSKEEKLLDIGGIISYKQNM